MPTTLRVLPTLLPIYRFFCVLTINNMPYQDHTAKWMKLIRLDTLFIAVFMLLFSSYFLIQELGFYFYLPKFSQTYINTSDNIYISDFSVYRGRKTISFEYNGKTYVSPCYYRSLSNPRNTELSEICDMSREDLRKLGNNVPIRNAVLLKPFSTSKAALIAEGDLLKGKENIHIHISSEKRNSFIAEQNVSLVYILLIFYISLLYILLCAYFLIKEKINFI